MAKGWEPRAQAGGPPLVVFRGRLFSMFAAALHSWIRPSIRLSLVTGTHLT
jgi:hypothetical protein